MRRIIAITLTIFLFLCSSALADDPYNLENYSTSEIETIYSLASQEAFGCIKVPTGLYVVGKDLPSGIYTILENSDTPGNTQDDFSHVAIFNSIYDYQRDPYNIFDEGSYAITACNTLWNGLSCELIDDMVLVVYFGIAGITKANNNLFSVFWDSEKNQNDKQTNNNSSTSNSVESMSTEKMYAYLKESMNKGEVKIKPLEWPKITVDQFLLSDSYIAKQNSTKEEILYSLQSELPKISSDIYSLSPSGNSGLFRMNRGTVTYYNGKYIPPYPTDVHGYKIDLDKQTDYYRILDKLSDNSVVYSHNGRYASVFSYNNWSSTVLRRSIEPSLIDLKTGEIIVIGIFADVQNANPGYITTGCFSLDDKYFYYNVFRIGEETNTLYRYCIETETSDECCSIPLMQVTANMYETEDNHLITAGLNINRDTEWLDITQTDGNWIVCTKPFPLKSNYWSVSDFLYSYKTGFGIMTHSTSSRSTWFLNFFNRNSTESNESSFGIVNSNDEFIVMSEEEFVSQVDNTKGRFKDFGGFQIIRSISLSPDGHFALILVGNKQSRIILVDLETKETCLINGIEETIKAAPLGPTIEWNNDKLIVFTNQNQHRVYCFDY